MRDEQPEKRGPLSLRTRWARGLAAGGFVITVTAYLHTYENSPLVVAIGFALGLAISLASIGMGIAAQRAAMAERRREPEAIGSMIMGSVAAFFALMLLGSTLVYYSALEQYTHCMSSALTVSAQTACQNQLTEREKQLTNIK
jgi:high-affinity nickel permease